MLGRKALRSRRSRESPISSVGSPAARARERIGFDDSNAGCNAVAALEQDAQQIAPAGRLVGDVDRTRRRAPTGGIAETSTTETTSSRAPMQRSGNSTSSLRSSPPT